MLNLGMTEIFCFAVIALLVLGPDKLPEAARFVAKWYGKVKKFINNIQNEIDRELKLSEFREEMQKEIEKITELERRMQMQLDELKKTPKEPEAAAQTSNTETKSTSTYQPYTTPLTVPFRSPYQILLSPDNDPTSSTSTSNSELKIAV
jgi:sec-independent protein translocase protein TatB